MSEMKTCMNWTPKKRISKHLVMFSNVIVMDDLIVLSSDVATDDEPPLKRSKFDTTPKFDNISTFDKRTKSDTRLRLKKKHPARSDISNVNFPSQDLDLVETCKKRSLRVVLDDYRRYLPSNHGINTTYKVSDCTNDFPWFRRPNRDLRYSVDSPASSEQSQFVICDCKSSDMATNSDTDDDRTHHRCHRKRKRYRRIKSHPSDTSSQNGSDSDSDVTENASRSRFPHSRKRKRKSESINLFDLSQHLTRGKAKELESILQPGTSQSYQRQQNQQKKKRLFLNSDIFDPEFSSSDPNCELSEELPDLEPTTSSQKGSDSDMLPDLDSREIVVALPRLELTDSNYDVRSEFKHRSRNFTPAWKQLLKTKLGKLSTSCGKSPSGGSGYTSEAESDTSSTKSRHFMDVLEAENESSRGALDKTSYSSPASPRPPSVTSISSSIPSSKYTKTIASSNLNSVSDSELSDFEIDDRQKGMGVCRRKIRLSVNQESSYLIAKNKTRQHNTQTGRKHRLIEYKDFNDSLSLSYNNCYSDLIYTKDSDSLESDELNVIVTGSQTCGDGKQRNVMTFSEGQQILVEISTEDGKPDAHTVKMISQLTSRECEPTVDNLRDVLDLLIQSKSIAEANSLYKLLKRLEAAHPPHAFLPFSWDDLELAIHSVNLQMGIYNCDAPYVIQCYSNILAVSYMVSMLGIELQSHSLASQRQIFKSQVHKWFTKNGSSHCEAKQVASWLTSALNFDKFCDISTSNFHQIDNRVAVELHSPKTVNSVPSPENMPKVLPILNNLLCLIVNSATAPMEVARKIGQEFAQNYMHLSVPQRRLLINTLSSPLLKLKVIQCIMESHCGEVAYLEICASLEELIYSYFTAEPPRSAFTPPTTPNMENDEMPEENSQYYSAESCEELVVLLYGAVESYIYYARGMHSLPLHKRVLENFSAHHGDLCTSDRETLHHLPRHVRRLKERLLHARGTELNSLTRVHLVKLECLSWLGDNH